MTSFALPQSGLARSVPQEPGAVNCPRNPAPGKGEP